MNEENVLTVRGLSRRFGAISAVKDISFHVKRGEILGFLGPNGAGKSTTMKMVAGILPATSGHAQVSGHDVVRDAKRAKRALGFLPERAPLYTDLTVYEYLTFCAQIHGLNRKQLTPAVNDIVQRCNLGDVQNRLIGNLSKGFQQRTGLAQALVHSPELVILDEPSSGLDPSQIREMRALIREVGRDCAVLISTHGLTEAQTMCDRVQILHRGEIVWSESIDALTRSPVRSVRVAMTSPPSEDTLLAESGAEQVERIGERTFRLLCQTAPARVDRLLAKAVADDWGLYELAEERLSLEEIFVDLTCRESSIADSNTHKLTTTHTVATCLSGVGA